MNILILILISGFINVSCCSAALTRSLLSNTQKLIPKTYLSSGLLSNTQKRINMVPALRTTKTFMSSNKSNNCDVVALAKSVLVKLGLGFGLLGIIYFDDLRLNDIIENEWLREKTKRRAMLECFDSIRGNDNDKFMRTCIFSSSFHIDDIYNEFGVTAFEYALRFGKMHYMQKLIDNGANISHDAYRFLFNAIIHDRPEVVKLLVSNGANVNYKDQYGVPMVFYGINTRSPGIIRALIESGADINVRDEEGDTCYAYLTDPTDSFIEYLSDDEILALLISYGFNTDLVDLKKRKQRYFFENLKRIDLI